MYKGTLCEKLSNTFSSESEFERVSCSIKNHIYNILNTNKGSVRSNPDFGIDLIGDSRLNQHDLAENIALDIEKQLLEYDPRVKNVRVQYKGESSTNPERIMFQISGIANIGNENIEFYTSFTC